MQNEPIRDFQTLHEIVRAARMNLSHNLWDYLIGGAESEATVKRNRLALDSWGLRPRVLNNVVDVDCGTELLGRKLRLPVILSPIGSLQSFEAGGGATATKAAEEFGCCHMLSSVSEPGLEAVAAAGKNMKIFQLYVRGDDDWVDDVATRAIDCGYDAFAITVDVAHYSRRERDIAKRFEKAWARRNSANWQFQATFDWKCVERFKAKHDIPLFIKGIAVPGDALRCVELGVEGVYVSNHGGRQLDQGLGSVGVLPEIVDAVDGKAIIVVDGGICRGTDVVKAIALGADMVGMGRMLGFGLAAAGQAGVVRMLELLEDEVRIALGLLGVNSLKELDRSYLAPADPVVPPHVLSAFPLLDIEESGY
jgi:glycolate oxidase